MHLLVRMLGTAPLPCWPIEVEGQGEGEGEGGSRDEVPAAASPPSLNPAPTIPIALPPSLPLFHQARYDIRYGILGSVGTLTFSVGGVAKGADGAPLVKVEGAGAGAVMGLGAIQRKIEAEFDPLTLQSRRWTILRMRNGQSEDQGIRDTGAREKSGAVLLERSQPGRGLARQTVTFAVPTSDPLGLLWRLRTAPPAPGRTEVLHLLDGLALWQVRVTAAPAREILSEGNRTAIRLDGDLTPVMFDGQPDGSRPTRRFSLWLSDSTDHLPLRLEVPVGLADVVMTLTETHGLPSAQESTQPAGQQAGDLDGETRGQRIQTATGQLATPVPGARNL